jgi:hypothetical protein
MSQIVTINRRTFLKGAGALIALPFFESLGRGAVASPAEQLTRFCFLYVPNGMSMENWKPRRIGPLAPHPLPPLLSPLAAHLEYITVASGLDNRVCEKTGRPEALGQHARGIGALLSAVYPHRELRSGETLDVVLAKNLRGGTRIPLLNLGTEYAEDQHDDRYSEVFNYSLSWKDEHTPIQPIISPRFVFELLCGDPGAADRRHDKTESRRSVLDSVLESGKSLGGLLNSEDRRGLEDYFENIRTVEQGIGSAEVPEACAAEAPVDDDGSYDERLKVMFDLLHLALRSKSTQVATLLLGAERSERDFGFLTSRAGFDMSGGYHSTSHHKNKPAQIRKYAQIGVYFAQHLGRFLQKLKETREGEGNLLDHTFILYGSSMADGNTHEHYDLPILLAGKGGGLIDPGKNGFHIHYGNKPISNLYLTLLQKMTIADSTGNLYTSFGDSGGTLSLPGGS